jgi:hypothetical protein
MKWSYAENETGGAVPCASRFNFEGRGAISFLDIYSSANFTKISTH